ncbi:MAG: DUF58 domain-containing protein [bacterium]|nr:DUF58 domain-containing protein [bacterium]MDZ4284237.1 DUF58 domain-containing protein [Patescibacteria group bacterium]
MPTPPLKKPTSLLRFRIDKVIADFRGGVHRSAVSGSGIDFRMVREYDLADPLSRIDWLASARLSDDDTALVVREYHPDREIGVLCAIDAGSTMEHPRRKRAYSEALAWLFALSAFRYRDRFELVHFDVRSVRSTDWGRTETWLADATFDTEPSDLTQYIGARQLTNTLLIVISDFNETTPEYMRRFRTLDFGSRNVQGVFFMLDEWAGFEPVRFRAAFFDSLSRSTRALSLHRGGRAEREALCQSRCFEELRRIARPLDIPCITVPLISADPLGIVHKAFLRLGLE